MYNVCKGKLVKMFAKERTFILSQQQETPNKGQGANKRPQDYGQEIADIVRDSLSTGDLSHLRHLGPAVQGAVNQGISAVSDGLSGAAAPGNFAKNTNQKDPAYQSNPQNKAPQTHQGAAPMWQNQPRPVPTAYGYRKIGNSKGLVRIILGIVGMVTFGLCSIAFALAAGLTGLAPVFAPLSAFFSLANISSIFLLANGLGVNRLAKRAQKYYALFEKKPVYHLDEMAKLVGLPEKKLLKDIEKMKAKGWVQDLYLDDGKTCVMRGEETYRLYIESAKALHLKKEQAEEEERQMQDPEKAALQAFKRDGVETIAKIRAANDAIPGHEISEKLSRLEASCSRIFSYVEEHPKKLPDTRKFMDYYMPTTLKLVEKYRQYDEMDYQPANVIEAKTQIEGALETIDIAYKNLLEGFCQPDTLDVSTDIVVLQSMLEQEGLVGKQFNLTKNLEKNPPPL